MIPFIILLSSGVDHFLLYKRLFCITIMVYQIKLKLQLLWHTGCGLQNSLWITSVQKVAWDSSQHGVVEPYQVLLLSVYLLSCCWLTEVQKQWHKTVTIYTTSARYNGCNMHNSRLSIHLSNQMHTTYVLTAIFQVNWVSQFSLEIFPPVGENLWD